LAAARSRCPDEPGGPPKAPQLSVSSGAPTFADPQQYLWTMGFIPSYQTEARIYANHILATKPDAKIVVLYQSGDFDEAYPNGLQDVLGAGRAHMIVKEASYETSPNRRSIRRS
jgi:branched-chain amino acid transport system substrate-binding protein